MSKTFGSRGYYESKIAGKVYYQSSYEKKFIKYLDEHGFNWERCKDKFDYIDSENNKRKYNPDFYLKDYDLYIEVKGMIRLNDPFKFKCFPIDKKLLLIDFKKLRELGIQVFNPINDLTEEQKSKDHWPNKILSNIDDYSQEGIIDDKTYERISKYFYLIKQ